MPHTTYELVLRCHDGIYLYIDLPLSLDIIKEKLREHPKFPYTTTDGRMYQTSEIVFLRDKHTLECLPL